MGGIGRTRSIGRSRSPARPGSAAGGGGLGTVGLLLEQLGDDLLELAPGLDRVELALGVDHEHRRDGVDPPGAGEFTLPALTLVVLGPGDPVVLDVLLEAVQPALFLRLIEADP